MYIKNFSILRRIGAGVMLSMTGLFGFCPMCAMVGRKLYKGV